MFQVESNFCGYVVGGMNGNPARSARAKSLPKLPEQEEIGRREGGENEHQQVGEREAEGEEGGWRREKPTHLRRAA